MAYEIDYIPVGDGERSGDAIALRFGNLIGTRNEQIVIVIDGGFEKSGKLLVDHIKNYYNTDLIDIVISTHPDADHASGLYTVLENMRVSTLFMHKPWDHAAEIKNLFKNGKITQSGLEDKIEKSLQHASDLETLANDKGVNIYEPFQGANFNNILHILGPSKEYYESLLPLFRCTPEPKTNLGILTPLRKTAEEVIRWIEDNMEIDILDDDDDSATAAENNSSTIILLNIDNQQLLFTGDAGKTALTSAINFAKNTGILTNNLAFFDVPHHGSKHNLSSKIIKEIKPAVSFISASKNSPKHPAKKITNALKKHGSKVFVNRDITLLHHNQGIDRGWKNAEQEPFHSRVEE